MSIVYNDLKHQTFIQNHQICFNNTILSFCFTPLIGCGIYEIIVDLKLIDYQTVFCNKNNFRNFSPFLLCCFIFLIICLWLLIKLYSTVSSQENDDYKTKLIYYFYGFVLSFPYSIAFFINYLFIILDLKYQTVNLIFNILFYISFTFSHLVIVGIYCFNKEHWKYSKEICCCNKSDMRNTKQSATILFVTLSDKESA